MLLTRLPDNHSMLVTGQVFLFDYPDTITAEPHPEMELWLAPTVPRQTNAQLKKKIAETKETSGNG